MFVHFLQHSENYSFQLLCELYSEYSYILFI